MMRLTWHDKHHSREHIGDVVRQWCCGDVDDVAGVCESRRREDGDAGVAVGEADADVAGVSDVTGAAAVVDGDDGAVAEGSLQPCCLML